MCKLFCFPIIHRHTNFTRIYDIESQQFEKAQSETDLKIVSLVKKLVTAYDIYQSQVPTMHRPA